MEGDYEKEYIGRLQMLYGVVLSFDVITHALVLTNNTMKIEQTSKEATECEFHTLNS